MSRRRGKENGNLATPVIETYRGLKHTNVIVGASAIALPSANLSYRKSILIQNNHASQVLYLGGGLPDVLIGSKSETEGTFYNLDWVLSASGTNEWYAVSKTGGDPSLTEPKIVYYATRGADEVLGTNGTAGALAAEHQWDWASNGTFNTFYIRTNGSGFANSPAKRYDFILAYTFTLTADETAVTGGLQVQPGGNITMNLDGSARVFGIASGATTPVAVTEFV